MKPLRTLALAAVALAVAGLPACNRAASNRIQVAFISNNEHEFWRIAEKGTQKAAAEFDVDVQFKMPPGGGTPADQRRFIEDLITLGIKGIAISPNDPENQTSFFREVSGKVPLLMVDNDATDPGVRRCYVGTDNVAAGRAAGQLVKKALPDGGAFMIFVGRLDATNAVERRRGVVSELAGGEEQCREQLEQMARSEYPVKFGKYTLLGTMTDDGKQEVCRQKVDDTLTKHPEVKCLVGLWAYNPPAMLEGTREAKKLGKVSLVAFDENEETLQGIKDGHIIGTVVQNPYQFGYQAVKIMAGLARGDEGVLKRPDIDGQRRIYVPHRIVTKEGGPAPTHMNVEDFHTELKKVKGS